MPDRIPRGRFKRRHFLARAVRKRGPWTAWYRFKGKRCYWISPRSLHWKP